MYKVFINDKPFVLTDRMDFELIGDKSLYLTYSDFEEIHFLLELLQNSKHLSSVILYHSDLEMLWADFRAHYREIEAGGGLVLNDAEELILIHRLGKWDLPKGKLEEGETPAQGAFREVREEVGLEDLHLDAHFMNTYHTYEQGGYRILKTTYWYIMKSEQKDLIPEVGEHISQAVWKPLVEIDVDSMDTYANIRVLLNRLIVRS
jgi:8-oxo-dGTP pyrophosphatase MutT (NUDIX family)